MARWPFARVVLPLVVASLLVGAAGTAVIAQVEGETWTSPTYGFSVSWAGTGWEPDPEGMLTAMGPERLDRIHLLNGVSSLYFEGATRYQGDLSSCVAEEANLLAEESGVSEIRPYRNDQGVQLTADGPDSSAAAFTLTLDLGDQQLDLVDYVECRTLIPGEAVLVITLVTEPAGFDAELASAQVVIDTIAFGVPQAPDPLAAYGGWLAAAQSQPSVAGPLFGEIAFGPDVLGVERAGVDAPDFYARAEFTNPEPAPIEAWDFGLGFRDSGGEDQLRLVVDSAGTWFLKDGLGPVIASGAVVDVDTSPGGTNIIEIVAVGDTGYFAFNERLVGELDFTAAADGGDVFVGSGFFHEDATEAGATAFRDFEIWTLAGIDAGSAVAPAIAVDDGTFRQLADAAIVQPPLAGPASGELVHTIGAAAIVPAGAEVDDFVASVTFINPSDASDEPWDFGIAFREVESGDHFRLTVASDGSWEYQIGLQTDLAGGTVPSLNFAQGALNTLELVVAGDSAGFAINGAFVSELDASELDAVSDVWTGTGFHRGNLVEDAVTRFQDFTVWAVDESVLAPIPVAEATPEPPPAATPVASVEDVAQQTAIRLLSRADPGISGLAVLSEEGGQTTISVTALGAQGDEVVIVHRGDCEAVSALPAFLLADLNGLGQSETTIEATLASLSETAHSIAIHQSAENYADILACGDISQP